MLNKGQVVLSSAGRDRGGWMAVLGIAPDGGILVADGRRRPIQRPKRKNPRHLTPTGFTVSETSMATNRELRRALTAFGVGAPDPSQEGG